MKEALNPPSRRLPKARRTAENPKCQFVKTSKLPRENRTDGDADGDGRKDANLTDLRECKMKAETGIPRHFAARHGMPCGRRPPPRQQEREESVQKGRRFLYAESLQPEGKSRPKPRFSPLSTHPKISLRQEIFVFAARKKFLSAKKFHFCRTKTPAVAEKCFIRTVLMPVF